MYYDIIFVIIILDPKFFNLVESYGVYSCFWSLYGEVCIYVFVR